MTLTNIALPERILRDILRALRAPDADGQVVENVVFAFAKRFAHGGRAVLRVELIEVFANDDYAVREPFAVQLRPEALARVVALTKRRQLVPIKLHRHIVAGDRALAFFSGTDDAADVELADLFGANAFASVLLADKPDGGYAFHARTVSEDCAFVPAAVLELGLPITVYGTGARADTNKARFARARLEFGAGIVNGLSELRLGVIGCGGLGWRAASGSADSGIASLLLLDRDRVEERNLLRLEGATDSDVGRSKVLVLSDYLNRRHPGLDVAPLNLDVIDALDTNGSERDDLLQALGSCDALLLVTDNHPSRLSILIEAERLGIPYVHCGMHAITPHDMYCRLSVHVPHVTPCAVCAKNVDRAEGSRRGRGYVEGIDLPNVAAWNAIAAGHVANAVRMLTVPLPAEKLRDVHAWEIGLSRPASRPIAVITDAACKVCGS